MWNGLGARGARQLRRGWRDGGPRVLRPRGAVGRRVEVAESRSSRRRGEVALPRAPAVRASAIGRSARANARTSGKRSAGSRASARTTASSNAEGNLRRRGRSAETSGACRTFSSRRVERLVLERHLPRHRLVEDRRRARTGPRLRARALVRTSAPAPCTASVPMTVSCAVSGARLHLASAASRARSRRSSAAPPRGGRARGRRSPA